MTREQALHLLRQGDPFDLLVIGGGATGCGIAVDAASRGLKTALVEKNDFAEGTSSRSTKLVHGGVRYLEAAVRRLDPVQYRLVREGLRERGVLLRNAPHLVHRLPLVTPLYRWRDVPYLLAGLKLYDLLAGRHGIGRSRLVGRREALRRFPLLKPEGLKAGILYYDGQFNDARLAVALAMTAQEQGAVVANHLEVVALEKRQGRICGARLRDRLRGGEFTLEARGVINATGPFADRLRQLDDPAAAPILRASTGVHLVLDRRLEPPGAGLMIPRTEDGRVLFILPWEGHPLVGTTDEPAEVTDHPQPKQAEIDYLLRHLRRYFGLELTTGDLRSTWSGLRPLVAEPGAAETSRLARDHLLQLSPSGLLTIAGGKWTTYRRMAEDAVDQAVRSFGLQPAQGCRTPRLPLAGAAAFEPGGWTTLERTYGLDAEAARHLHQAYGDRAPLVAELARDGLDAPLDSGHPYLEAEVIYAVRHEFAQRAVDVLVRRTPLALLDRAAARAAGPRVIELMAGELGWDDDRRREETALTARRLQEAI